VLLVASANETKGPSFKHAASLLDEVETARLGAVLNRFQPEQQRAGYGYGYSYSYGYGYGYDYGYGDEDLQAYGDEGDDRRGSFVADRVRAWWKGE
jgi:Mrp family chromosome partitioning ATPase